MPLDRSAAAVALLVRRRRRDRSSRSNKPPPHETAVNRVRRAAGAHLNRAVVSAGRGLTERVEPRIEARQKRVEEREVAVVQRGQHAAHRFLLVRTRCRGRATATAAARRRRADVAKVVQGREATEAMVEQLDDPDARGG